MEPRDDVDLAADPLGLIGHGAGQRAIEELLAKAADIDGELAAALDGEIAQAGAELPGCGFVKLVEYEFGFLAGEDGKIVGHGGTFYSVCAWRLLLHVQSRARQTKV